MNEIFELYAIFYFPHRKCLFESMAKIEFCRCWFKRIHLKCVKTRTLWYSFIKDLQKLTWNKKEEKNKQSRVRSSTNKYNLQRHLFNLSANIKTICFVSIFGSCFIPFYDFWTIRCSLHFKLLNNQTNRKTEQTFNWIIRCANIRFRYWEKWKNSLNFWIRRKKKP